MDSYVVQGNRCFWANLELEVSKKVWKIITNIGITRSESKEVYEDVIRMMELRDQKGKNKMEAKNKKGQRILYLTILKEVAIGTKLR